MLLSLQRKRQKRRETICADSAWVVTVTRKDCTALTDKLCSALYSHSGWLFSSFDCLLDAESSSVIENESKGTGTQ